MKKSYAIRRYKNPTTFEYLLNDNRWGSREDRKKFSSKAEAESRARAYTIVGVHAKVVPYGTTD
jgi:hypothetical protein